MNTIVNILALLTKPIDFSSSAGIVITLQIFAITSFISIRAIDRARINKFQSMLIFKILSVKTAVFHSSLFLSKNSSALSYYHFIYNVHKYCSSNIPAGYFFNYREF